MQKIASFTKLLIFFYQSRKNFTNLREYVQILLDFNAEFFKNIFYTYYDLISLILKDKEFHFVEFETKYSWQRSIFMIQIFHCKIWKYLYFLQFCGIITDINHSSTFLTFSFTCQPIIWISERASRNFLCWYVWNA